MSGIFYQQILLPSTASVKTLGVGVFWDAAATQVCSYIDWGIIEPGTTVNRTVFIRNQANVPTTLYTFADHWAPPEVESFVTYSWNYSGATMQVDEILPYRLSLAVTPIVVNVTNFSFTITIGVTG